MAPISKIEINSNNNNIYEVEISGKLLLNIHINHIIKENEDIKKISPRKYKNKLIHLDELKKLKEFEKDNKFQKYKDFSFIINLIKNNNKCIEIEEDGNNLNLIIKFPEEDVSPITILFELLNVEYYLVYGRKHERQNKNPFYTSLNSEIFTLNDIKSILSNDKISDKYKYNIISYKYYNEDLKGFIKIDDYKNYQMPNNNLIIEIYFNKYINYLTLELDRFDNNITNEIKAIKKNIKLSQKMKQYDLIYLYASPINKSPINYRKEIKDIINLFNKSGKSFNCLFECANESIFRDVLLKKTKILHISSHGEIDNEMYSLVLEEKGKSQKINYETLKKILNLNKPNLKNIDLVFVSTCHSQHLGELFFSCGVKNVIYIKGENEISNICSIKFTEYLYDGLIKGLTIKESYDKSIEKIKFDREVINYNLKSNCCCRHQHEKKNQCYGHNMHIKKCDCFYDQFHIHKVNCKYHLQIKEKIKNGIKFSISPEDRGYIKICCCDYTIDHCEYLKIKDRIGNNVAPFKIKEKGILDKNKNACVIDFAEIKNISFIGRAKQIGAIYDIINDNSGRNKHFLILYGEKEIGKQDFAESLCVYLFERKIIEKYENIELKTEYDFHNFKNKIANYSKYEKKKNIIIIKISYLLDEKTSFKFVNKLLDEINVDNKNLFYLIILATEKEKIESYIKSDEQGENNFELINLKIDANEGKNLLENLCRFLGCHCNYETLKRDESENLLKLVNYQPKKIKIISNLIDKGYSYEKIKEYIESKKINERKEIIITEQLMEKDISRIYFLLSFMPSGLPDSLIKLIYQNCDKIIVEEDKNNRLIYKDPDNNWNYLNDCKKEINIFFKDKKDERKQIISKCLKVYAFLLFFYIEKNKQNICFPDNNIHYIFNSYNGTGIWKSFDIEMYKYCFYEYNEKTKKEYENIINYDFDLERHSKNIINLMMNNLDDIKELLKNNDINKEFIEQILLMLPSCYFLKKECKDIIIKCKYICEKLDLDYDAKRLFLFLNSLEIDQDIDLSHFNNLELLELKLEAKFLKFLKKKDENLFKELIKEYENLIKVTFERNYNITPGNTMTSLNTDNYEKNENKIKYSFTNKDNKKDIKENKDNKDIKEKKEIINEIKIKLVKCYYEMAGFYFLNSKKNNKEINKCKGYLAKAKKIANELNNYFLMDRINIDLFLVSKKFNENNKINQINEENIDNKEIEILDEVIHQKKYMYPYNQKLQTNIINEAYKLKNELSERFTPDILMLNANPLKNDLSVLNSGIFSYHNNQYYLLEQLNEKIRRKIKIESNILNKENLQIALNKKGKILIIQSDDFTVNGEIILESDKSESQLLPNEDLKNLLPVKIKFDILILCFVKSEKIKKFFEDKVQYLITLDDIDCYELDGEILLKYNKLCMDFIIKFIEKITEFTEKNENNIEESFENAKHLFINGLKDYRLKTKYINLTKNNNLTSCIKFEKNKYQGKIILNNPLLNLPPKIPLCKDYSDEILNLITLILSEENQYINIYITDDSRIFEENRKKINQKTMISIELMKFFYRHQTFNNMHFINYSEKLGNSFYDIVDNVLYKEKKKKNIIKKNKKYSNFVLINNYKRKELIIEKSSINDTQYLIMSKEKIIIIRNKNDIIMPKSNKKKDIEYVEDKEFPILKKSLNEDPKKDDKKNDKKENNKKSKKKNNKKYDKKDDNKDDFLKDFHSIFDYNFEAVENLSNKSDSFDDYSEDISIKNNISK